MASCESRYPSLFTCVAKSSLTRLATLLHRRDRTPVSNARVVTKVMSQSAAKLKPLATLLMDPSNSTPSLLPDILPRFQMLFLLLMLLQFYGEFRALFGIFEVYQT